jgi:hypothetical protein
MQGAAHFSCADLYTLADLYTAPNLLLFFVFCLGRPIFLKSFNEKNLLISLNYLGSVLHFLIFLFFALEIERRNGYG